MNTELDPGKVTQLLNQSTRQMSGQILSALNRARQNALERHAVRTHAFALAPSGGAHTYTNRWMHWAGLHSAQHLAIVILLAAVVISGVGYWHHVEEQKIGELDVAILTDDLPVEVFVDH
ncbi:MAG: DUF3619 family protein [Gallionellaceae bacterium]|jgi:hypothetical protein|nr:DUF3619 family protein [Gallionellaceae bacterium]